MSIVGMKLVEVTKEIGRMWKELSEKERDRYAEESNRQKEVYEREMKEWKERQ